MIHDEQPRREPMMSDKWIDTHELPAELARHDQEEAESCRVGMRVGRRFYENLIKSGELLVARTAEVWHPSIPEEEWRKWLTGSEAEFGMLVTKCCSRNPWCPPWGLGKAIWDEKEREMRQPRLMYVCPGCGARIIQKP